MEASGQSARVGAQKQLVKYQRTTGLRPNKCFGYARTPRFPAALEERQESFIVKDANGQQLAYLYFEDEPQRRMSMKRLSRDEAFLIAMNIAKLPSVPRQILKDIPRPPNSAE